MIIQLNLLVDLVLPAVIWLFTKLQQHPVLAPVNWVHIKHLQVTKITLLVLINLNSKINKGTHTITSPNNNSIRNNLISRRSRSLILKRFRLPPTHNLSIKSLRLKKRSQPIKKPEGNRRVNLQRWVKDLLSLTKNQRLEILTLPRTKRGTERPIQTHKRIEVVHVTLFVLYVKKLAIKGVHSVRKIKTNAVGWTVKSTAINANVTTINTSIMMSWQSFLHPQEITRMDVFLSLTKTLWWESGLKSHNF